MGVEDGRRPDLKLTSGFKSIKDFNYGGRFLNAIEVNEKAIKQVFELAGLVYSGIAIESMPRPDIDISTGRRKKPLFTTEKINNRWRIQVNDEEMMEKLERKDSRDGHRKEFIQELNGLIKAAVFECIRKERSLNGDTLSFDVQPEALNIVRPWFFVHPLSGVTLTRESK